MRRSNRSVCALAVIALLLVPACLQAQDQQRVFPDGTRPADIRLNELQNLNGYFPFRPVADAKAWPQRQKEIRRRLLISQGLWPEPVKTSLNAVVHGRIDFDDYTVEKVYFESVPGHFVTGTLYRPKNKPGPFPAVLCPHGHWSDARFYDAGEAAAKRLIASGAERFMNAARNHIQARCVQLARMGCIAFFYDMTGNCDSIQIGHRPDNTDHLDTGTNWGYFSVQAELRLQNMMGLQTWNSVRSIDFLLEQPDVDSQRIGVTGASGGGTQAMIIAAIDDRVTAAMPCVMVSTSMQGGCTCENAPLMRIDQGNIDIAAAIAPRPLALTAADDWTRELETKGYPALQNLYEMLGVKDRLTAVFHIHFPHNYNHVNRTVMYSFFNRHFNLRLPEPVLERDFELLTRKELTVWDSDHPAPSGDAVGDTHEIKLLQQGAAASEKQVTALVPTDGNGTAKFDAVLGGAWTTILGRQLSDVGDVKFLESRHTNSGKTGVTLGTLNHSKEQLPAVIVANEDKASRGFVVWVSKQGKTGIFDGDKLRPEISHVLNKGYTIVTADLFGQGEFATGDDSADHQRMWYQGNGTATWHRFSGYTFGYNHPLFVQRCHDLLTLIRYAKSQAEIVHLIGRDEVAGPLVLAARSQAGNSVDSTFVDTAGFAFAKLTRHDDPMFVPGAVKYLGIDGLAALCAPHKLTIARRAGKPDWAATSHVYGAKDASPHLTFAEPRSLLQSVP